MDIWNSNTEISISLYFMTKFGVSIYRQLRLFIAHLISFANRLTPDFEQSTTLNSTSLSVAFAVSPLVLT